jgi:hypothetical protein
VVDDKSGWGVLLWWRAMMKRVRKGGARACLIQSNRKIRLWHPNLSEYVLEPTRDRDDKSGIVAFKRGLICRFNKLGTKAK